MLLFVLPFLSDFVFFFFVCLSGVFVVAVSVSEAQQSLITGKRTQRRKQTPQGGEFSHSARKTLFSTCSMEKDVENWSTGAAASTINITRCTATHTMTETFGTLCTV